MALRSEIRKPKSEIRGALGPRSMSTLQQIGAWWSRHPMTYGSDHGQAVYEDGAYTVGSPEFFGRLDQELYQWNAPLHTDVPFGRIFPYQRYQGRRVLEIGCGLGAMTALWAKHGAQVSAVDLSPKAVELTQARLAQQELPGSVSIANAQELPFPDGAFAYVYSWGVLHHAPRLDRSIAELMRVLEPGGEYGVMLYNRNSLLYRYLIQYVEGFLHDEARHLSPLGLASRYSDGARAEGNPHTWPVTRRELRQLLSPYSRTARVRCFGTDLDTLLPGLLPLVGGALPQWVRKPWARRFGWSVWASGVKRT
jgi:SAM-dependent methyltransferase